MGNLKLFFTVLSLLCASLAHGQSMYKDKAAVATLRTCIDFMHGFYFDKADSSLKRLAPKFGNTPGFLLMDALINYWRFFPIKSHPAEDKNYKATLERASDLAEALTKKDNNDPEAIFYSMMANSLLGRQASEDEDNLKAVNYVRKAFSGLKKGFELEKQYPDFFFSSGLYKYYRVRYPEDHPAYKPFLVFFQDGDKEVGLRSLELASDKGLFSKTDALSFLAAINLHYELKPAKALSLAQRLVDDYPRNPTFRLLLCEALAANNRHEDIPTHAGLIHKHPSALMRAGASAVMGLYYEKKKEKAKALSYFTDALARAGSLGKIADNTRSIGLAGQARLAAAQNERYKAKKLYKDVLHITNNSFLRNEAHYYIKRLDENGDKISRKQAKEKAG